MVRVGKVLGWVGTSKSYSCREQGIIGKVWMRLVKGV